MFENSSDSDELKPASWPERMLLWLAMLGILGLCLIVTVTVVSRWLHKPLIPDDVLIVREMMVAVIILPLAAVSAAGAHIAVTVFTNHLGARGQSRLNLFGQLVGLIFVLILAAAGWRLFIGAWQSGEYFDGVLYLPMWIGYATFVVGLFAFALRLLANTINHFRQ